MTSKEKKKDFMENRTSWKWFKRKYDNKHDIIDQMNTKESFMMLVQLEILKELQHLNDKTK